MAVSACPFSNARSSGVRLQTKPHRLGYGAIQGCGEISLHMPTCAEHYATPRCGSRALPRRRTPRQRMHRRGSNLHPVTHKAASLQGSPRAHPALFLKHASAPDDTSTFAVANESCRAAKCSGVDLHSSKIHGTLLRQPGGASRRNEQWCSPSARYVTKGLDHTRHYPCSARPRPP